MVNKNTELRRFHEKNADFFSRLKPAVQYILNALDCKYFR